MQRRNPTMILFLATAAAIAMGPTNVAKAERLQPRSAPLVREAMVQGLNGRPEERARLLDRALKRYPDDGPARWQSGYVKRGGQWSRYDEAGQSSGYSKLLATYRVKRAQADASVKSQLDLANWCARKALKEQARAHWTNVLAVEPNHATARAKLGFVLVDGAWRQRQDVRDSAARARQAARELRDWKPKLLDIAAGLEADKSRPRRAAARRLAAIDDPAAIPALEVFLSSRSEVAARGVVATLAEMSAPTASLSLVRHAMFLDWQTVGQSAAEQLCGRDEASYVPTLLAALRTPVQCVTELYQQPAGVDSFGRLLYTRWFYREGAEQRELAVLQSSYWFPDAPSALLAANQERVRQAAQDLSLEAQNLQTEQLNSRVCSILNTATSQDLPANPAGWWSWWKDRNEVYVESGKPWSTAYLYRDELVTTARFSSDSSGQRRLDCLAAGTPVWTEAGPVAVEQIEIGDLVLSQDPTTGELAYQPVLGTTIRPAGPLVRIQLGGESLQTSGGHPFWVAGQGWLRARQLRPGMSLHGVDGVTRVEVAQAADDAEAQTYNLIVDGFHTYFAGNARVLTHDNTVCQPSSGPLPGLAAD